MKDKLKFITSMLIFGSIGLFVKNIALSGALIAFFRAVLGIGVLLCYALVSKTKLQISKPRRNLPILIISGVAMGFNWVLLFEAYRYTTVANATFVYYMAPIFVLMVSPVVLRVKINVSQWVAISASLCGMYLILGTGGTLDQGLALALGAAALYAFVILCNQKLGPIQPIVSTLVQLGSAMGILFVFLLFRGGFAPVLALDIKSALLLVFVGVVHTGLAYLLYFSSMAKLPTFLVAIYSYIDPMVATLLSLLLLGEASTPQKLFGGALILGSSLFGSLAKGMANE